ncbi:MAG: NAD(P)H-dependent oxidoreductase [archaeon]|nr:NAD(P)H-dependent oxidoreductase [archaeon]
MENKIKVLAICSSPRKGNTYSALKVIEEYPDIDYKILMLKDLNFEMCKGCYTCVLKGEEKCPLKDDRDMIINEMVDADGIIFASPVYVNHATALMKNFMERFGYYAHRPIFQDKFGMVMATCGMFGSEETNKFMEGIFNAYGFNMVSSLELQMATKTEKEKSLNREKTFKAVDTLINRIKDGTKNSPTMDHMVRFNIFKIVSALKKDLYEADYQYYKDKTEFVSKGKVSSTKKKMAKKVAEKMVNEMMGE